MKLVDLSSVPDVTDTVITWLNQLCERLEFDFASYATTNPVTGDVQGYANYPDAWKLHYAKNGFHRFDPTLYKAALSIAPVEWGQFTHDDKFKRVFRDARDFGISDRGITVPIRGPYGECGMLSVTRDCKAEEWEKLSSHVMGELQMAAVHIHDNIMKSGILAQSMFQPRLSSREHEILQWVAVGKSQQDIGDILDPIHNRVKKFGRSYPYPFHQTVLRFRLARAPTFLAIMFFCWLLR